MKDSARVTELEDIIRKYHDTVLKEREIKEGLVSKLETIKELVLKRQGRGSKPSGIPFGTGSARKAEGLSDKAIVKKIRQLVA